MESEILKRVEELRATADHYLRRARRCIMTGAGPDVNASVSIAASQLALLELQVWQLTRQFRLEAQEK